MPCFDGGDDYEERERFERMTRVSCEIMGVLESIGVSQFSYEVQDWWESHKADDKRREQARQAQIDREEKRHAGLSKLTDAEKRALGL